VKTEQTPAPIPPEQTPTVSFTRLIAIMPSTSIFAGWGPRMNSHVSDIFRRLN